MAYLIMNFLKICCSNIARSLHTWCGVLALILLLFAKRIRSRIIFEAKILEVLRNSVSDFLYNSCLLFELFMDLI